MMFEVRDGVDYMNLRIPPPRFIIDKLLAEGEFLMIYGDAGVRKTFLGLWMGFCIATGTDFFEFRVNQSSMLIGNFELTDHRFQYRFHNMGNQFSFDRNQIMAFTEHKSLMVPENFAVFRSVVLNLRPQACVIDCMQEAYARDELSEELLAIFFGNFRELADETGTAFVFIHHENKNEAYVDTLSRIRGHSYIKGKLDAAIRIVKQPNGGNQLQYAKVRHVDNLPNTNIFFEDGLWRLR